MEIENIHRVQKKQWKKWTDTQRVRFNMLFGYMFENQELFKHPKAPLLSEVQWKTTCWNAAWMANDI